MSHIVNTDLIALAKAAHAKEAFVPADAAAGGGGGAPPPGGDPMAAAGGDPMAAGGGAPPMDPAMAGGGGDPMAMIQPMIDQAVQAALAGAGGAGGAGGGAGAGGGGLKPKIDVNVEIMQIKNMLARVIDNLGIQMPAQEMVATQENLEQMAANPGQEGGVDGGPGGAPGGSAIQPIQPMQAAAPEGGGEKVGHAFENGVGYQPSESDKLEGVGAIASQVLSLIDNQ